MMKVSELSGALLDYWVARAEEIPLSSEWDCCATGGIFIGLGASGDPHREFWPSVRWEDGGPIIERERIAFVQNGIVEGARGSWVAFIDGYEYATGVEGSAERSGPTQLIAAMRAFVAHKFGDEVDGV